MSTFSGLPAHILLVHAIVILVPLTAALAILSAVWAPARRRLVWLCLVLAAFVVVLTPLTTEAGEWLERRVGRSPGLHTHTQLGDSFVYFALPLLAAIALLAFAHVRETRGRSLSRWLAGAIAALTIVTGVAASVQVYRIGESGARSVWSGVTAQSS